MTPDACREESVIDRLLADEADDRVAIELRVRLGGEPITAITKDYGYPLMAEETVKPIHPLAGVILALRRLA